MFHLTRAKIFTPPHFSEAVSRMQAWCFRQEDERSATQKKDLVVKPSRPARNFFGTTPAFSRIAGIATGLAWMEIPFWLEMLLYLACNGLFACLVSFVNAANWNLNSLLIKKEIQRTLEHDPVTAAAIYFLIVESIVLGYHFFGLSGFFVLVELLLVALHEHLDRVHRRAADLRTAHTVRKALCKEVKQETTQTAVEKALCGEIKPETTQTTAESSKIGELREIISQMHLEREQLVHKNFENRRELMGIILEKPKLSPAQIAQYRPPTIKPFDEEKWLTNYWYRQTQSIGNFYAQKLARMEKFNAQVRNIYYYNTDIIAKLREENWQLKDRLQSAQEEKDGWEKVEENPSEEFEVL